jgi:hypothetical protein
MSSSPKASQVVTAAEILVSATGLTLLMIVMIEAVFLFW